jgi:ankyrin repeat protein
MNSSANEKKKNKQLLNSVHQKPFLSIDSEFTPQELYSILTKNPYLVNTEDEKNETFLSYAIKRNNNPIINLILTSPILNLTYQNNTGNTYLHLAVIQQNLKLVQNLLDKGIFIDIQNNDGNTALHLAYYVNNLEIIKLLINNDIDFGIKNKKGLIAEEIDQTDNINEIAGYDVNLDSNYESDENDLLNLCLNQNEDKIFRSLKLDSRNSGETKYNSQSSKEKKDSIKNKPENVISQFNDNKKKNKNKRNSVEVEDKIKINKILMSNSSDNNISNKKREMTAIKTKAISNIAINDNSNDSDKNLDNLKTIDNNFPLYEEPLHTSQDFAISDLDISKKHNSSNFLENNELNLSSNIIENDNNSIQTNEFFCNEKGANNSLISNIPIKDENIKEKEKNEKANKNNKKEEKIEKVIKCDNKPLYEFLMQIHMEKYYDNFNNNGFEFINMVIDDTKLGNHLTDKQLKDIGINIPGDRAKILIRFEEKANMFEFTIPKSVYYISYNLEKMEEDLNICKLNGWLRNIRLEQYIRNFILNGYFSLDLLLVQAISKNPLTDDILKDDFGIKKLGHRARILNKLKEESKHFSNKLRDSIMSFQTEDNNKICTECILC